MILYSLLAQTPAVTSFWPVTVAGWITLVAAFVALGYALYDRLVARVKRVQELNGFGGRVKLLEEWQARYDESATERALIMERLHTAQEVLLTKLGGAEASAAACHVDTEKLGRELGDKIDRALEKMDAWERRITLSVNSLEVELRTRGILTAQPPSPPAMPLPLPRERP